MSLTGRLAVKDAELERQSNSVVLVFLNIIIYTHTSHTNKMMFLEKKNTLLPNLEKSAESHILKV